MPRQPTQDGWAIVARQTIIDGLCLDWYRAPTDHSHSLSASRTGVYVSEGVSLHTIPEEHLALADSIHRLLASGSDADRELAKRSATHRDDGSRGMWRGNLVLVVSDEEQ